MITGARSPAGRILLPLGAGGADEAGLLSAASVLSHWFRAPMQLVATEPGNVERIRSLSLALSVEAIPPSALESGGVAELLEIASSASPCVIVAAPDAVGLHLARHSTQPVFLAPRDGATRLPTGPLVLEPAGPASDASSLAVAAVWAAALDLDVRLVSDSVDQDAAIDSARTRLESMGVPVEVDRLRKADEAPLVLAGRTRQATAVVIDVARLDETTLVADLQAAGVPVLVAPAPPVGATSAEVADVTEDRPVGHRRGLEPLSREECEEALAAAPVGRLGYVDGGWPVVVPVNHRVHDGVVFIQSLPGGKLAAARRDDVVCLQVDLLDEADRRGVSVLAHGHLHEIVDPAVLHAAWGNEPDSWVDSDRWQWLQLDPFSLTGRRLA